MTWSVRERKVPGGKLLRVKAECAGGTVSKLRIEGDFFLYPEEGVTLLERSMIGATPTDMAEVKGRLERTIEENRLKIMGFSIQDVAELLREMACSGTDGD